NDGCIIARSNEAKALGLPMGAPVHEWAKMMKREGVKAFSCNFELYADVSSRVMRVARAHVPRLEVYSVDEAFLDLRGAPPARLVEEMRTLRAAIAQGVGIPVCIGIAPSKVLAKAANHVAKKNPHYAGIYLLHDKTAQDDVLEALPLRDVWGLGRKLSVTLEREGVAHAKALRDSDAGQMRRCHNVVMERLIYELRGIPCLSLEPEADDKRMIQASRSFGRRIFELSDLKEAIAMYVTRAASQMRGEKLLAQGILVYVRTSVHGPQNTFYAGSHMVGLPAPSGDTRVLINAAHSCLNEIYKQGPAYYKAGIHLLELVPEASYQPSLLHDGDSVQSRVLMGVMDRLDKTFGKYKVRLASTGLEQSWQVKHEMRSPRYSTQWKELVTVR
ncbi:MAG: Y-family DNA polymerase, partial [Alphaproteobacteria bacterium]